MSEMKNPLHPHERLLVIAIDSATREDIAEISHEEICGLTGEFSPKDIIEGFAPYPERIADVLEKCVGTKRTIGRKVKPITAIDNLTDALTPDATGDVASSPKELFEVVTSHDLVNHQEATRLWSLIMRHEWTRERNERRQKLMRELLEAVLALKLISAQEYVEAVGTDQFMGDNMPANLRKKVLDLVLTFGRGREDGQKKPTPFDDTHLVNVMKPEELVQYVELSTLENVLIAVAKKYKWVPEPKVPIVPQANNADATDDGEADTRTNPPPAAAPESNDPDVEVTVGESSPSTAPPSNDLPEVGDISMDSSDPGAVGDAVAKNPDSVDKLIDDMQRPGEPGLDYDVDAPTKIVGSEEMTRIREGSKAGPLPKGDPDKSPAGGTKVKGPVTNLAGPPPLPGGRKSR
jgi:hypothetical protein